MQGQQRYQDILVYSPSPQAQKYPDCPSTLSNGSTTATTKQFKADSLNQFFTSCFNPSVVQHLYGPSPVPGPLPDHLEIIPGKVATLLKKIKPHSASGPHSISAWMLRFLPMLPHLPLPLSSPSPSGMAHYPKIGNLAMLFLSPRGPTCLKFNSTNQSLCYPSSVRFWSIMFSPFYWSTFTPCVFCQTVNLVSDLVAACTSTPRLIAVHRWHSFLERRMHFGCIFTDLKKAFDSVPHQALRNQFSKHNLRPHPFAWLSDYVFKESSLAATAQSSKVTLQ